MPRFLNTYTGEFVWIPEVGVTPYAILSHTWRSVEEGGEQTYDDIVKLQTECPTANRKPWNDKTAPPVNEAFFSHPNLSDKIKRACEVARNTGFRLIWIDSCCIDKRSSAELSEAINSMYALYRDADVCYVYLADVPRGTNPRAKNSEFRKSRWHRRGWTLQELVAPPCVIFLTDDWTFMGTKTGLASTLQKITGVDAAILLGLKPVESASVAKRMSWAARRETTRVEDRAYSLLGIFGVYMSPIYGEGKNAFLRLQEEIIKHIPDQSIFAWGPRCTLLALDACGWEYGGGFVYQDYGLLAPSPTAFADIGDISPIIPSEFAVRMGRPPPALHCVFTPQGARIELVTIPLPPETAKILVGGYAAHCPDCREAMAGSPLRRLALLRCTDRDGHLIALPLHCPDEDVGAAENVAIGVLTTCGDPTHRSHRVVRLSPAVMKDLDVAPTRVEVSLLRHWQEPVVPKARRRGFSKTWSHPLGTWAYDDGWELDLYDYAPKILFAPYCEEDLDSLGFTLTQIELRQRPLWGEITWTTTLIMNGATEQPPYGDQHAHVPLIRIELVLLPQHPVYGSTCGQFAVDRFHRPSTTELSQPALQTPVSVSSGPPLHDESRQAPSTAGNPYRQSRSFDAFILSPRTIAEAEFLIPDCTVSRTGADGSSMDYVRLLRLKLDNPLESAYDRDCYHPLLSVEFSEPFVNYSPSTESVPAATPSDFAPSENQAHCLLQPEAATEPSIMQNGPSPTLGNTLSPHHDGGQETPETAVPPIASSEETVACEGSPGTSTASNVVLTGPHSSHISVASTPLEPLAAQKNSHTTTSDSDVLQNSVRVTLPISCLSLACTRT
ncbi:heterokaryon incompatibility protein-domain-containing protein [Lenzites betulinus]|nr:heterokaryon incompatibility protein-domain-containing protein [Lenzites betulinus]